MTIDASVMFIAVVWLRHLLKNKIKYGGINARQVLLHAFLIVLTIVSSLILTTQAGRNKALTAWTFYHTTTFLNNITIAIIMIIFNLKRQKVLI